MTISCLDLEGVLVPEIWIQVAEKTKIKELRLTTRDVPDYDTLMTRRLEILCERRIGIKTIQSIIAGLKPLKGAKSFLESLRKKRQVVILSDTFYEFAMPLMHALGHPTLFCNELEMDKNGMIKTYHLRQIDGKKESVLALKKLGFRVTAAGDSYNDIMMLKAADAGILFCPPVPIAQKYSQFYVAKNYTELLRRL